MPKTVTLTKPLLEGKVTEFTFREPRFGDYMDFGDPRVPIPSGDDEKVFMRPIPDTVRSYAERLLVDGDPAVMGHASLRDTIAIQGAILGFFRDAESAGEAKKTSSSGSDGNSSS